ncbi:MAG: KaiC associated regulatory domain-containing protein [Candidatus Aenigmarchaeota archaeon]|nr:KaiC associated regulatory domain-containing protein [Candidatus Aenigmarchaeota archaeon]
MEIIKKPHVEVDIDELAERIFHESIRILGGLKNLIEFRNLTWLPSLAEAAYVIAMKNEALMTKGEIARKLGITEQTVENILRAKEEELEKYIIGEKEKIDEHKAGALAKLAYKHLKERGEEIVVDLSRGVAQSLGIEWAVYVLTRIKGLDFPVDKEQLAERLKGLEIMGKRVEDILEELEYPIRTPAQLLKEIKKKLEE